MWFCTISYKLKDKLLSQQIQSQTDHKKDTFIESTFMDKVIHIQCQLISASGAA